MINEDNQPLCVSFYYIIYIVNICFLRTIFSPFYVWRQFSKSWTPSFLPYTARSASYLSAVVLCFPQNKAGKIIRWYQPLCVSFYYIIYSKCMLFWECFLSFTFDANFQKAGRLHSCLIPAPVIWFSAFFFCYSQKMKAENQSDTNPCVFLFIILYI